MSEQNRKTTVLGQDCRMKGELTLDSDAVILGQFDGDLSISGVLEIGPDAQVSGSITAGMLRLAGRAEASVVAEGGVEMLPGAELIGQVHTSNLQIVEGAVFQGEVFVGPDAAVNADQGAIQTEIRAPRPAQARQINRQPQIVSDEQDYQQDAEQDVRTVPGAVSNVLQRRRTKVLSGARGQHDADAA